MLVFYDIQYQTMINLQNSKRLIRTYDKILIKDTIKKHYRRLTPDKRPIHSKNTIHTARQIEAVSSLEYGKQISKMIIIQFELKAKAKQKEDIRLKRKVMTSTQKFYSKKQYPHHAKQSAKPKQNDQLNSTFLAVGSRSIRKMDYFATTVLSKDFKIMEENHNSAKYRLRNHFTFNDIKATDLNDSSKVLIIKRRDDNHVEDVLFASCKSQTEKKSVERQKKLQNVGRHKADSMFSFHIEQFIPVRKNTTKKQPFVFGMTGKQQNPQKNRDKLILYHDFLWKINYSNGLYIRASPEDAIYKAYVGSGNNSNLIRSLLKRRFWWSFSQKSDNCNFCWTQLKINNIFKQQNSSNIQIDTIYSKHLEVEQNLKSQPVASLQQGQQKIFSQNDLINWNRHMRKFRRSQASITEKTYKNRLQFLSCKQIRRIETSSKILVHNHLEQNYYIGNKKALFYNMKKYYKLKGQDVFNALPLTFHITKGIDDAQFAAFLHSYNIFQDRKKKGEDFQNVWIIKPGQNSNRGNGITVCHGLADIKLRLKSKQKNIDGSLRTFILQKYMEKPLLYKGRKFDIRHYLLLTCINGILKAYWFPEGYIRTSSSLFTLKRCNNLYIHLTNDAVQKNSQQYGKYQKGNKISYQKFQHYLNKHKDNAPRNLFYDSILPQMKSLALQAVKSTYLVLDPQRRQHNFELLGMDFMIDDCLKPWLIQINTNPCLELSCPLLETIIPSLVEQVFRICIDPLFPPPEEWPVNKKMFMTGNPLEENQFQLIFDESVDGQVVRQIYGNNIAMDTNMGRIEQDDQVYENEGEELQDKSH